MFKLRKPQIPETSKELLLFVPQLLYYPAVFKAPSSNPPILGVPGFETTNFPNLHSSRLNIQHEQQWSTPLAKAGAFMCVGRLDQHNRCSDAKVHLRGVPKPQEWSLKQTSSDNTPSFLCP